MFSIEEFLSFFDVFNRYLYGELINYANGSAFRSILETSEKDPTKTQLKNHVSIHLLVSGAPTGDAREFLPTGL